MRVVVESASNQPVNSQAKDRDPRKANYVRQLLGRHPYVLSIWRDFGLLAKTSESGYPKRQHMVTEHMITVAAGAQALGLMLRDAGLLVSRDIFEVEEAGLVHDVSKPLEVSLVEAASEKTPDRKKIEEILARNGVASDEDACRAYAQFYGPIICDATVSTGIRAVEAFSFAGAINDLRLASRGVSAGVREIAGMEAFDSCPLIETLLVEFNFADIEGRRRALQMFILNYIDSIVTSPNRIDPSITLSDSGERLNAVDRRAIQNEQNPGYIWNHGWKEYPQHNGETAMDTQKRVSHQMERLFARLLGVNGYLMIPAVIDEKIKEIISNS